MTRRGQWKYWILGGLLVALPFHVIAVDENITDTLFDPSKDIATNFVNIYNQSLKILLWFIILMIIVAGYVYITSMGNPERVKLAKDVLATTLVGAAIWLTLPLILEAIGLQTPGAATQSSVGTQTQGTVSPAPQSPAPSTPQKGDADTKGTSRRAPTP